MILDDDNTVMNNARKASCLQGALQVACSNNAHKVGEVELFRALLTYFADVKGCQICEVHGAKGKVGYDMPNEKRCEIADLLIVAYSHKMPCMKINFWQAKKANFLNQNVGLIKNGNDEHFRFVLDAVQYKLLKECPLIDSRKTGFPPNILSDSCSPEITSYGVFYKIPNSSDVDMAFEITHFLRPESPIGITPKSSSRVCRFSTVESLYGGLTWTHACGGTSCPNLQPCECKQCNKHIRQEDLISTIHADEFEEALKSFRIGSPVCGSMALTIAQAVIAKYLPKEQDGKDFKEFVKTYLNGDTQDNWRDNGGDRSNEVNDMFSKFGAPKFLLLVNVDET